VADDANDVGSTAQSHNPGNDKDVLFGWLVGRAAADLGLAHALAASEAQRSEQIKRLEESLLAQIQELQKQAAGTTSENHSNEMEGLRVEVQTHAGRIGSLESASQQTQQLRDSLGEFHRQLQKLNERISQIESAADRMFGSADREAEKAQWSAELDEHVARRIRDFGDVITEKFKGAAGLKVDQEVFKTELATVTGRLARMELGVHETGLELHTELNAVKATLSAQQGLRQESESVLKALEDRLSRRMEDAERDVRGKLNYIDTQMNFLGPLQAQMASLSAKVSELVGRAQNDSGKELENSEWAKKIESDIAARLGGFDAKLTESLGVTEGRRAELDQVKSVIRALEERLGQLEATNQDPQIAAEVQRTQQLAATLGTELASLKADLSRKESGLQHMATRIDAFEGTLQYKLQEMQNRLLGEHQAFESRDLQFLELKNDMESLMRRVAETESAAHQTHALAVIENEQALQLRDVLRAELDTLKIQLKDQQLRDSVVQNIEENLNGKISELQHQLGQRTRLFDHRDAEFRELKEQIRSLSEKIVEIDAAQSFSGAVTKSTHESAALPADLSISRPHRVEPSIVARRVEEGGPNVIPRVTPSTDTPVDHLFAANKEQLKQLQERMSAEIERARAELKEKSSRWKVRR
jgi:DNA repair exonuclease SbcCD ATPase subunit